MTSVIHSSESKEPIPDDWETGPKKLTLIDLVENIDDLAERAKHIQVTRNEYLDTLREVTAAKINGIKEAKQMFDKRIRKMIKAQNYELKSQAKYGAGIAQGVFRERGEIVKSLFQAEVKRFEQEYEVLDKVIRMQDRQLKKYCRDLCQQEVIIGNLANHISVSMRGRFEDRIKEREAFEVREQIRDFVDPYKLLTKNAAFDFYGRQVRVAATEDEKFLTNTFIKESHHRLQEKSMEVAHLKSELAQMHDLL